MTAEKQIDLLLNDMSIKTAEDVKNYQEEVNEYFAELIDEELALTGQE